MKPENQLPVAVRSVAVLFMVAPALFMAVWPSGWRWEPHHHEYEQMIVAVYFVLGVFLWRAAADPDGNRSLISFTAWSSAAHAAVMAAHAFQEGKRMHLLADVPALLLIAALLLILQSRARAVASAGRRG